MQGKNIIRQALLRQPVERVPIVNIFNLNYLVQELNIHQKSVIGAFLDDHFDSLITFQEKIGHDPVINLLSFQEPDVTTWPSALLKWEDNSDWNVQEESKQEGNGKVVWRTITTPDGSLVSNYRQENCQKWALSHPLQTGQTLAPLYHRPEPARCDTTAIHRVVNSAGERAFIFLVVPGVFEEACALCGIQEVITAFYHQGQWVKDLFAILRDYTLKIISAMAITGIDCVQLDESTVGIGISPKMFSDWIFPYDRDIVQKINDCGMLSSFHVCGKSDKHLELIAETGTTAIETLAMPEVAGDVSLASAKSRVGAKAGLWGGFNERVLKSPDPNDVRQEAWRCLNEAAAGGGFVLRGCGQVYEAIADNWKVLADTVADWSASHLT